MAACYQSNGSLSSLTSLLQVVLQQSASYLSGFELATMRENVPSSRFDLSITLISGPMLFSSISQFGIGAARKRDPP